MNIKSLYFQIYRILSFIFSLVLKIAYKFQAYQVIKENLTVTISSISWISDFISATIWHMLDILVMCVSSIHFVLFIFSFQLHNYISVSPASNFS